MNMIVDACRNLKETKTKRVSKQELSSAIRGARTRGWRISGPHADGTYVVWAPPFLGPNGRVCDGEIHRVPGGNFLFEYIQDINPLIRLIKSQSHSVRVRQQRGPELRIVK